MTRPVALALAAMIAAGTRLMAQTDERLDVAAQFEIQGLEPSTAGYIFTRKGIAETLVNADAEGQLTPGLATAWQVSNNGLTWRFDIRDGVTFHDGTALTADAVASALEIARAKPGPLKGLAIETILAKDGAVVVTLSEPLAALPAFFAEFRSQILASAAYGSDGMVTEMIGTGPYRLTVMAPPLSLTADAFPAYWGAAPKISSVGYAGVSRVESRALMAESGDADFVFGLDLASVARLSDSDAVDVLPVAIPRTPLMKVNARHPFLADV